MASGFLERREQADDTQGPVPEATGIDRRQFPPPADPATVTPEAQQLQNAIDTYKFQRRLKRITVVELLGILESLGYSR